MEKSESQRSGHPEQEKRVSSLAEPPPGQVMDLADQVWKRSLKTLHQVSYWGDYIIEEEDEKLSLQELYCGILLLYNDINKTLRPGSHRDPPAMIEVRGCIKTPGEIFNSTVLNREDFNSFFATFTNNQIRREELQALFKTGPNQQFGRSAFHTRQESGSSSKEAGPSRNVKTEDPEDLLTKKLRELRKSRELESAADGEELKGTNGSLNVLRHGRTDAAANLNSFSGGSHFQIINFAGADVDSLATFVKQIRK